MPAESSTSLGVLRYECWPSYFVFDSATMFTRSLTSSGFRWLLLRRDKIRSAALKKPKGLDASGPKYLEYGKSDTSTPNAPPKDRMKSTPSSPSTPRSKFTLVEVDIFPGATPRDSAIHLGQTHFKIFVGWCHLLQNIKKIASRSEPRGLLFYRGISRGVALAEEERAQRRSHTDEEHDGKHEPK